MSTVTSSGSPPPNIDIGVVMELLGSMKSTNGTLTQSLKTLQEQGNRVKDLGPTMSDAEKHIVLLRNEIDEQDTQRAATVERAKETIRGELREKALKVMSDRIKERIGKEVRDQVEQQIKVQLVRDHLGTPLDAQVELGREQVTALRSAVTNSNARRTNAAIPWSDVNTAFAHVVRPDGTPSAKWPANLRSLLDMDDVSLVRLGHDYELHEHPTRGMKINAFLCHIGVVAMRHY